MDNLTTTAFVQSNYGLMQGMLTISLLNDVYYSFRGIPYARPPLGELRFKASRSSSFGFFLVFFVVLRKLIFWMTLQDPEPLEPWTGIRDATKESPPCWHRDQFSGEYLGSENCLHLNVYSRDVRCGSLASDIADLIKFVVVVGR